MQLKIIIFFFISLISFDQTRGQTINELIELHYANLQELYQQRSASPYWTINGKVGKEELINKLANYNSEVGILIYSYVNGILSINILGKKGLIASEKIKISKDSLINQIDKANKYFSISTIERAPKMRGVVSLNTGNKNSFQESYKNLKNILFPFKQEILHELSHLIIVPIFNISTLPFSALSLSDNKYLIDYLSYSIAPSLFEVMVSGEMNKNRVGYHPIEIKYSFDNALFIANPKYPSGTNWTFPDLPGANKEVDYITGSYYNQTDYVKLEGQNATLTNTLKDICQYDILYFATHGIASSKNPLEESFLVLADDKDGSFLTAKTIQEIGNRCRLNSDLVILSACQTGLGKVHEAGMIGLPRAFQISGANHILMSLWNISDSETAILMGFFFDYLKAGGEMMPHEALRQSILKYRTEISDNPNYWAAFSIFGIPY